MSKRHVWFLVLLKRAQEDKISQGVMATRKEKLEKSLKRYDDRY